LAWLSGFFRPAASLPATASPQSWVSFGTDLAQGPILAVQVDCTLNVHRVTVTACTAVSSGKQMADPTPGGRLQDAAIESLFSSSSWLGFSNSSAQCGFLVQCFIRLRFLVYFAVWAWSDGQTRGSKCAFARFSWHVSWLLRT
jgi:hypothetical protein